MLYVPIKIYPNEKSIRGSVIMAVFFLGLGLAAMLNLGHPGWRFGTAAFCLAGFFVAALNAAAAMRKQPMLKVLDDRFSLYTPFGYAMVRFGAVLAFRKSGLPGMRSLRVEVNRSSCPRFDSGSGRFLHGLLWLSAANAVSVKGYMLGAELDSVINMLEKRRVAAVRLEAVDGYDPTAVTSLG